MTAKDYMQQAYLLDKRINAKIDQLSDLNDLATKATSTLTDMPHSPNKGVSSLENTIVKIVDLQEEINSDIDRLVDLKRQLKTIIDAVDDIDQRYILERRYLCWANWPEIAVEMNMSCRRLFQLHDGALEKIQGTIERLQ